MTYDPKHVKQGDGTACQWQNCVAASTAMAVDRHTLGKKTIRPSTIRRYYSRYCPGIPFSIAHNAVKHYKAVDLPIAYWISKDRFKDIIMSGRGAVAVIKYARVLGTPYQATRYFTGLHAVFVNDFRRNKKTGRPEYQVYDPLADGRYPWIPKGAKWWPAWLLHGAMEDSGGYNIMMTKDTGIGWK